MLASLSAECAARVVGQLGTYYKSTALPQVGGI